MLMSRGCTVMKSRDGALKLKRFEAEEKQRKVADIEAMIHEFEQMATDLDRQIASEEERTGIRNEAHFAYSTFARAASQRRDNLRASVADLREKLEQAVAVRNEAVAELEIAASAEERGGDRSRRMDRDASDARMS
jgi:flagellar protein FliJ